MRKVVGLDRKLKRIWLDAALDHLGLGRDDESLRAYMDSQLIESLPSKESRAKALAIILRVWSTIPPDRLWLRNRAIELLPKISGYERVWLHWGMTALAYPFFRDGAEVIGRLLSLQDDFTTRHVQDRIVAGWGDRTTCKLAARYLLNTLEDWEILRPTKSQGHFLPTNKIKSESADLQLWLLEALMSASESNEIEAQQLLRLPEAFPFAITIGLSNLRKSDYLAIHRQGLDMDMVGVLRKTIKPVPKPVPTPKNKPASTKSASDTDSPAVKSKKTVAKPKVDLEKAQRRAISVLLKKADAQSLPDRVERFQKFHDAYEKIDGPFAEPIRHCIEMYRDGYFDGCIAISTTNIEQIVQSFGKAKTRNLTPSALEKALSTLVKKGFISDPLRDRLVALLNHQDTSANVVEFNGHASLVSEKSAHDVLSILIDIGNARRENTLFS
jgi:hypothetical protein